MGVRQVHGCVFSRNCAVFCLLWLKENPWDSLTEAQRARICLLPYNYLLVTLMQLSAGLINVHLTSDCLLARDLLVHLTFWLEVSESSGTSARPQKRARRSKRADFYTCTNENEKASCTDFWPWMEDHLQDDHDSWSGHVLRRRSDKGFKWHAHIAASASKVFPKGFSCSLDIFPLELCVPVFQSYSDTWWQTKTETPRLTPWQYWKDKGNFILAQICQDLDRCLLSTEHCQSHLRRLFELPWDRKWWLKLDWKDGGVSVEFRCISRRWPSFHTRLEIFQSPTGTRLKHRLGSGHCRACHFHSFLWDEDKAGKIYKTNNSLGDSPLPIFLNFWHCATIRWLSIWCFQVVYMHNVDVHFPCEHCNT